jgi:CHAT domain-containing protein
MSFVFRASLFLLALSLNLVNSASAQSQSSPPDPKALALIHGSLQSPDEETVRATTEKYASAIVAGDIEAMRQLWNPQSPDLDSRLRAYQRLFSNARIEFITVKLTRLEVMGDKAISHLTTDERILYKKTGSDVSDPGAYDGRCRSFEWIRTGAGWRIEREFSVQDELANRLNAAASAQESDEILEKEKAFVTNDLVGSLTTRCERNLLRRDFDKALRCYQLQQAIAEKIGYQSGIAGALVGMAALKERQDDSEQALPLWRRALALYETAGNELGEGLALTNLGHSYHELGNYRKAFEYANKSVRLNEKLNHPRGMADSLTEMAHVYYLQNNFQQALAYYEKASLIYQELEDKIQIAILRYEIVKQHEGLGDHDRAVEIYQDILKQTEGHGDQAGVSLILGSIGRNYARQGRYVEAREYYQKSLQAAEASNFPQAIIEILIPMSEVYLAEGKYAEAGPLAEQAVSLSRQTANPLPLYIALTSVGYCQLGLNHPEEARRAFAEAISIIEQLRLQTAGGAEDRQRQFETGLNTYHGMLGLLVNQKQTREALVFAERAKARALLDTLDQGQVSVQKSMTADQQEQELRLKSELTQLNRRLSRATQSDKPDAKVVGEIKSRLEKTRLDFEAFQTSLYATRPELKVRRGEAPIIKAEELTNLLPDASNVLLEYAVTDDKTYLFAITKAPAKAEAEVRVYTLPIKREELATQTEAFRRRLANRDLGFRDVARRLYDMLLKPAQAQLSGKTNLVISPDDKLWDLPFQALLDGDNRYVLEKTAVSYAPSLTVLREMAKARRRDASNHPESSRGNLLAFGNPALGKEAAARTTIALRDEKLDPLPEAEAEVKGLGRLYGAARSKIYFGAEAREDRAKNEAGDFKVLHFATHGVLNNAAPMYSYLALAPGDKDEDGFLEAWELMRMDLRADLVVLSACETARGRFGAGEGMIGLSWAMFVAGAPAIVVSQWKVESAGARELMLSFHQHLTTPPKARITKAEALRQAALKLMKNPGVSHPFYWAGFVLVGDGR